MVCRETSHPLQSDKDQVSAGSSTLTGETPQVPVCSWLDPIFLCLFVLVFLNWQTIINVTFIYINIIHDWGSAGLTQTALIRRLSQVLGGQLRLRSPKLQTGGLLGVGSRFWRQSSLFQGFIGMFVRHFLLAVSCLIIWSEKQFGVISCDDERMEKERGLWCHENVQGHENKTSDWLTFKRQQEYFWILLH